MTELNPIIGTKLLKANIERQRADKINVTIIKTKNLNFPRQASTSSAKTPKKYKLESR